MSRSSLALSNLRGVVIVIVLAFHSVLAYLASLPAEPRAFDAAPYRWQAIPIVDGHRFFGFDLFCAWQDISLMSLMFFLSGLFVPSSLRRKGSMIFLSDRLLRIALPMALVVIFLMPVAYYPTYAVSAVDPSVAAYWTHLTALPFWPCGPQWFLWQLLALNVLAAALHQWAPMTTGRLAALAAQGREHPTKFFMGLAAISALVYLPIALVASPWQWTNVGPLSFQDCRPLHYVVYFFAGYAVGAYGLDRGLLAIDGALAKRWGWWLAASVVGFVVWALPTSMMTDGQIAPLPVQVASGVGFVLACGAGSFALLALCLRFAAERVRVLDSLSANAYGIYLLHYVFVVWLQYLLLPVELVAVAKAAIVLGGTLAMSWGLSAALCSVSPAEHLTAALRWAWLSFGGPAPAEALKREDLTG